MLALMLALVPALALLALPATPAGPALVRALLPAATAWLGQIEPAFEVRTLAVVDVAGRERLRLEVALAHPVHVAEVVVMPHPRGRARVELPLAQVWQGPLLLALPLLAWPAQGRGERRRRALLALPVVAVLLALDTPMVLVAELWQLLRQAHGETSFRAPVAWAELLRSGGRLGLALLAAAAVIALARRLRATPG